VSGHSTRSGVVCELHVLRWSYDPHQQIKRSRESLEVMGTSIAKGAVSTLLGLVPLAVANSASFRTFFLLVLGIVLLGLCAGICFVPALLSIVGVCWPRGFSDDAVTPQPPSRETSAPRVA